MHRFVFVLGVGLLSAIPASAQDAQIVKALGEAQVLEEINTLCPQTYSDVAVIDGVEDRVWAYARQKYGDGNAERMLSSDEMTSAVTNAAYDTLLAFERAAGGKDKLCAYAESGAIKGVTQTSPEQQPETGSEQDQPGYVVVPEPEPTPLPELLPEW